MRRWFFDMRARPVSEYFLGRRYLPSWRMRLRLRVTHYCLCHIIIIGRRGLFVSGESAVCAVSRFLHVRHAMPALNWARQIFKLLVRCGQNWFLHFSRYYWIKVLGLDILDASGFVAPRNFSLWDIIRVVGLLFDYYYRRAVVALYRSRL